MALRCHSYFPATSIIFVATKGCLPRQNFCRDKIIFVATTTKIVATKLLPSQIFVYVFVATKVLSRQAYFCRDKDLFCYDKRFCRDKMTKYMSTCLSRQKFCRDKGTFVATNTFLSRQNDKIYVYVFVATKVLWRQTYFCCDKHVFVATK